MIDTGMHGGGGGIGPGFWAALAALAALVALVAWYKTSKRDSGRRWKTIVVDGWSATTYDPEEVNKLQALQLVHALKGRVNELWPKLQQHYGVFPEFYLAGLTIDGETRDPKTGQEKWVYFRTGPKTIRLRPPGYPLLSGPMKHPVVWFCLEIHNVFRFYAFGEDKTYLPDDASYYEIEQWQQANRLCAEIGKAGLGW